MTKEEKVKKKKLRAFQRAIKNGNRNKSRKKYNTNKDCPFDLEMNGLHGTCNCNGENYNSCLGDI